MNMTVNRVRCLSVALLLAALLNHGIFHVSNANTGQQTSGLLRLARDLTRRTGGLLIEEHCANDQMRCVRATSNG
jgi:hypothetical protein